MGLAGANGAVPTQGDALLCCLVALLRTAAGIWGWVLGWEAWIWGYGEVEWDLLLFSNKVWG